MGCGASLQSLKSLTLGVSVLGNCRPSPEACQKGVRPVKAYAAERKGKSMQRMQQEGAKKRHPSPLLHCHPPPSNFRPRSPSENVVKTKESQVTEVTIVYVNTQLDKKICTCFGKTGGIKKLRYLFARASECVLQGRGPMWVWGTIWGGE